MTKQQAEWASKHDWFIGQVAIGNGNFKVTVEESIYDEEDNYHYFVVSFTDFQELREWAGY